MKLTRYAEAAVIPVSHDPELVKRVLLHQGQVSPILQISEFLLLPGNQVTSHSHADATEAFHLIDGTAKFVVDGVVQILSAGDLLVIEPGEEHSMHGISDQPARFYCLLLLTP